MKLTNKQAGLLIILSIFLSSFYTNEAYALNINVTSHNGTFLPVLNYDFDDSTNFTSFSFKDNSLANPNAFVKLCGKVNNESQSNKFIELAYTNQNCSEVLPLSVLPSEVSNINASSNCSLTDVDLASYEALYPGVLSVLILNSSSLFKYVNASSNSTTGNSSNTTQTIRKLSNIVSCERTNTILNGSYKLDVDVNDVSKTVSFDIKRILDSSGRDIPFNENYGRIIVDLINKTNSTIGTEVIHPKDRATFNYTFQGGEKVYINGLLSLKVITFNPCGALNKSGYYMLNASAWNKNQSCIVIQNISKITLNFANKTIDGDGSLNGSMKNNSCAVIIKDASNITIEDLRTEQFHYGLCIYNSSGINVKGTYDKANLKGVIVENSRGVSINDISVNNSDVEIYTINTTINLNKIHSPSANFSLNAHDVFVKTVRNPPKEPDGLVNISQWLTVKNSSDKSWAIVTFHYEKPLPNNALESTLDLYKYDYNANRTNGTWYAVPSYTDKIHKMIYSINISNFSVFVPLGEEVVAQPKTPPPTPPTTGHIQQKVISNMMNVPPQPRPPRVRLRLLNHTIKLEQGQSGYVKFNITNLGETIVDLYVKANISRAGWKSPTVKIPKLKRYETLNGTLYLSVYDNEIPGTYLIPVNARVSNMTIDTDVLKVIVIPRGKQAKMKIIESAPKVTFIENRNYDFPVLVKNIGDYNLTNITLHFDYADDCIDSVRGSYNLSMGEQKTLNYKVKVKKAYNSCDAILILKSNQKAIAFAPIIIEVRAQRFSKPIVMPILLIVFTILSIMTLVDKYKQMSAIRKKKRRIKEEFNSQRE